MTLSEFKAWFEGFTEDMPDRPTAKQWKRVQERVAEIVDQPPQVIYTSIPPRYYYPYWPSMGAVTSGAVGIGANALRDAMLGLTNAQASTSTDANAGALDHYTNMQALRRSDAKDLN